MIPTKPDKVFCSIEVTGVAYDELVEKARQYGAEFFSAPLEDVSVVMSGSARMAGTARFEDQRPGSWTARFTVGCVKEVDITDSEDAMDDVD